ncbi:hypothetical protein HK097_009408 [Rhizophlyctis rosea]|uniref:Uncharacterized protein n=1 Tax=Rhizophlyctis rosea TaxID=64517 RepID=A0AAD5SJ51_9FUNG|nr:hypothetical protein HK097_009408 [Rhizophlyctis rosea]
MGGCKIQSLMDEFWVNLHKECRDPGIKKKTFMRWFLKGHAMGAVFKVLKAIYNLALPKELQKAMRAFLKMPEIIREFWDGTENDFIPFLILVNNMWSNMHKDKTHAKRFSKRKSLHQGIGGVFVSEGTKRYNLIFVMPEVIYEQMCTVKEMAEKKALLDAHNMAAKADPKGRGKAKEL